MVKPSTFFILILLVLCLYRGSCGLKPLMRPIKKEVVINAGDSIYFECIYIDKIFFFFPEYNDNDGQKIVSSKQEKGKSEGDGLYKYVFSRRDAKPTDTGWYGCADHNETIRPKTFDDPEFSWIYFYVSSPDQVFVDRNNYHINVVKGVTTILPCRPSSPGLKIDLYHGRGTQQFQLVANVSYDEKFGFKLNNARRKDEGLYSCVATMNGKKSIVGYTLLVFSATIEGDLKIDDNAPKHLICGENLHVNCTLLTRESDKFILELNWLTHFESSRIRKQWYITKKDDKLKEVVVELIIKNVTLKDEGEYTCYLKASNVHAKKITSYIKIVDPHKKYITLIPQDATTYYQLPLGGMVTWDVMFYAYPEPEIKWFLPNGNQIAFGRSNPKYTISNTPSSTNLTIYALYGPDIGVYQLQLTIDDKLSKHLNFSLEVFAKPSILLKNIERYYAPGQNAYIQCEVQAFPEPNIAWSFQRYPHYPSKENSSFIELQSETQTLKRYAFLSTATIKIDLFGTINCTACNSIGCEYAFENIYVSGGNRDFGILEPKEQITEGDSINIVCMASFYGHTGTIMWTKGDKDEPIVDNESINVREEKTQFTYRSILNIPKVRKEDANNYTCLAETASRNFKTMTYNLLVNDPRPPIFRNSSLKGRYLIIDLNKERYNPIVLQCYVDGMPKPNVTWYKDEVPLDYKINDQYTCHNRNQEIHINYLLEKLSGKYTCRATNRMSTIEDFINILIKGKKLSVELISVIAVLFIVVVILVVFFTIKVHREKKLRKKLLETGLIHFEEGALEYLNPDLTVGDQADLLPYNKKWEFPRERLTMGKQIGSGAFGVVTKAEAIGIREDETVTTVAVKMVRPTTDPTYIRALANELKIMVHLGKHLNVVNLLGACTKNIAKCELLVIVEYCSFGNLHNYLLKDRANFINQIDPATGEFNFSIGTELANSDTKAIPKDTNNSSDPTRVIMPSDGCMVSDNSFKPDWSSSYRGDYKDQNLKPICTQDLLSWAFQVARGMEYLSQRKVLHGDLAARNILLADDNIVKICDFGLAKNMYKDDNYMKTGNELLPIKWMAIESIRDRVFSTQSDVWSFGIVLWEFFTLAVTPYPGMSAEKLYRKLIEGYRMEQPEYSTNEVYSIMSQCWQTEPISRPTFTELANRIGDLLEENVKAHYITLNEPYMDMNKMILNGKNDYLTMMSVPDHAAVSSARQDYRNLLNTDNVPVSRLGPSLFISESKDATEMSAMLENEDDPYLKPINLHESKPSFAPQREATNMLEPDSSNDPYACYANLQRNLNLIDLKVKQADVENRREIVVERKLC